MVRTILNRIIIGWLILVALVALLGDVSIAGTNVGRTAAGFLQIGPGARAAGLGGAYTALADGALAASWNPAGLGSLDRSEVFFSHFSWYQDITVEYGAVAFPLSEDMSGAASITYLNYGQIQGYDAAGNPTGDLSAYDLAAGVSVGFAISDRWSAGITGKFIRQQLDSFNGSAVAADLGIQYQLPRVSLAATVVNVGSKITFDSQPENLPAAFKFGVAATPFDGGFTAAIDLSKEFRGGLKLYQGVEFGFGDQYFIRTGYNRLMGEANRAFVSSFSVGAGIRLDFGEFDYSYTPQDNTTSEDIHRFSVLFRLGH